MAGKQNKGHIIRCAITVVCVICLVISGIAIGRELVQRHERQSVANEIQNLNPNKKDSSSVSAWVNALLPAAAAEGETQEEEQEGIPVHDDFLDLFNTNNDVVAWLEMGPDINLPVVYRDDIYYLDHDLYGNSNAGGTVFVNAANTLWPRDQNVILHGHHMKDGSMFTPLDNFRNLDYLKQNPIFYFRVLDQEEASAYVPIAVFDASMNEGSEHYFDIGHVNFDEQYPFADYVAGLKEHSIFDIPVGVSETDNLLTAITCSYVYDANSRLIVVAREVRADEDVTAMAQLVQQATAK